MIKKMQALISEYMVVNRVLCLIPPGLLMKKLANIIRWVNLVLYTFYQNQAKRI